MSCLPSPQPYLRKHRSRRHQGSALRALYIYLPLLVAAACMLLWMEARAQTMQPDHWSTAQLLERARHLQQLAAAGDGSASETIARYPQHQAILVFRNRSGVGELHQHIADLFYILDGHATLLTGGELVDPKTIGPGEIRAASVKAGASQELRPGDIFHIPAGTPHQTLVAPGETVTCLVVKIEESPAGDAR